MVLDRVLTLADPSHYSVVDTLRDGRPVSIRALRPDDRNDVVAAVKRISPESLYRRFFAAKREFTEQETSYFLNVDFVRHVALVADVQEHGKSVIVGGGRYVVIQPGIAEVAFTVVDSYQGQGIATALLRHLVTIARDAGLRELIADVLPDNLPMLKAFEKSGLSVRTTREAGVAHVRLQIR